MALNTQHQPARAASTPSWHCENADPLRAPWRRAAARGCPQVRPHRLRGGKPRAQRNRVARRGRPLPARGERGRQHAKLLWVGPGLSEAASRAGRRLARGTHHLQDAGDALPVCLHDVAAAVHHALVPLGRNVGGSVKHAAAASPDPEGHEPETRRRARLAAQSPVWGPPAQARLGPRGQSARRPERDRRDAAHSP